MIDPHAENYIDWSPYNYVGDNPIKRLDIDGKDWWERTQAIRRARQYVDANPNKSPDLWAYAGYHAGIPGKPIDCAGLVSESAAASGYGFLNNTATDKYKGKETGVKNIIHQEGTREVGLNDIMEGNIFSIDNDGHTGFIADVVKNDNGDVTGFNIIHSRSSQGPVEQFIDLNDPENSYAQNYFANVKAKYYAWDTPDPKPNNAVFRQGSAVDRMQQSSVPIVQTLGDILNFFGF